MFSKEDSKKKPQKFKIINNDKYTYLHSKNNKDEQQMSPLQKIIHSIQSQTEVETLQLLDKFEKNEMIKIVNTIYETKTLLIFAIEADKPEVVKKLVTGFEADVNVNLPNRRTPLLITFESATSSNIKTHLKIIEFLIERNANINRRSKTGACPLYAAVKKNHLGLAKVLVTLLLQSKMKLDVNIQPYQKQKLTPIQIVEKKGYTEVLALLQDEIVPKSINLENIQDSQIYSNKFFTAIENQNSKDALKLLELDHRFEWDINGFYKNPTRRLINHQESYSTFLMQAAQKGLTSVVIKLLKLGASINIITTTGKNVFHFAAIGGNTETIQSLIKVADSKKKISEPTHYNKLLPIHYAIENGHLEATKLLLETVPETLYQVIPSDFVDAPAKTSPSKFLTLLEFAQREAINNKAIVKFIQEKWEKQNHKLLPSSVMAAPSSSMSKINSPNLFRISATSPHPIEPPTSPGPGNHTFSSNQKLLSKKSYLHSNTQLPAANNPFHTFYSTPSEPSNSIEKKRRIDQVNFPPNDGVNPILNDTDSDNPENKRARYDSLHVQVPIKLEENFYKTPVRSFCYEKILKVIKILRGNNNSQINCINLTIGLLNYFQDSRYPTDAANPGSVSIETLYGVHWRGKIAIKSENSKRNTYYNAVTRVDYPNKTGFYSFPPLNHLEDAAGKADLDGPLAYDLTQERFAKFTFDISRDVDSLRDKIIREANEYGGTAFGFIHLPNKTKDKIDHVFVYFAHQNEVMCVDPQFYNGEKQIGNPIFELKNLRHQYHFYGIHARTVREVTESTYDCHISYMRTSPDFRHLPQHQNPPRQNVVIKEEPRVNKITC